MSFRGSASDRGNLIELRTGVSYGYRICFAQYIEIATPPSAVRNDTCGANRCYTAKLSFSGAVTYQLCVILSVVAAGNEVEESSSYQLFATGKILRFAQDDTAWQIAVTPLLHR